MTYVCPYLNRHVQEHDVTEDHIVPLSLGGCNQLTVAVAREANSRIGTEIEGALANEFFPANHRIAADAQGHNRRSPTFKIKNASSSNHAGPVRVSLSPKQIECFDPIQHKSLDRLSDISFDVKVQLDRFYQLRARFLAKVALGICYYEFGQVFHIHAKHNDLRRVLWARAGSPVWCDPDLPITVDMPVTGEECRSHVSVSIRHISRSVGRRSCLAIVPASGRLNVCVGILGHYAGLIGFDCEVERLWKEPGNRYGIFFLIRDKLPIRMGLREAMERLLFVKHCADVWSPDTPNGLREFIDSVRPAGWVDR